MSLVFTAAPTWCHLQTDLSDEIKGHPPCLANNLASNVYRGTSQKAGALPAEVQHSIAAQVLSLSTAAGLWGCSLLGLLLFSSSRTKENVMHGSQTCYLYHSVSLRKMTESTYWRNAFLNHKRNQVRESWKTSFKTGMFSVKVPGRQMTDINKQRQVD